MTEAVRKRSVAIHGHRTSFSLEDAFFEGLKAIARKRSMTLAELVATTDTTGERSAGLSTRLRLLVLDAALAGEITPSDYSDLRNSSER